MELYLLPGAEEITGDAIGPIGEPWNASLLGDRAVFNRRANPAPQAGRYTVVLPGNPDATNAPFGDSYGVVSVSASGGIVLSGVLADGARVTQTATLSREGNWPFYLPLYGYQGVTVGWLNLAERVVGRFRRANWPGSSRRPTAPGTILAVSTLRPMCSARFTRAPPRIPTSWVLPAPRWC